MRVTTDWDERDEDSEGWVSAKDEGYDRLG